MKSLITYVCITFLILPAALAQTAKGSGSIKMNSVKVSDYDEVVAIGKFDLYLEKKESASAIRISTDDNLQPFFQTRVENGILFIEMQAKIRNYSDLSVYVPVKKTTKITILDEVQLFSEKVIEFDNISLSASDLTKVNLELFANTLTTSFCDGAIVTLKGYAKNLEIKASDEVEMIGFDLKSDYCKVSSCGFTQVNVNVAKDIKIKATGQSNIYYTGDANISERIFSSTGFVVKRKIE